MAESLLHEALTLYEAGDLTRARDIAEDVLHTAELEDNNLLFAKGLLLLSTVHCAASNYDEAERLLVTCNCFVEEHLGPTHAGAATIRLNRAIILLERYRLQCNSTSISSPSCNNNNNNSESPSSSSSFTMLQTAYTLLREAEDILSNTIGVSRLVLAEILHNIGVCCIVAGRHTEALTAFMRSLQIRVRFSDISGALDLKLALTLEHVAMLYRLMPGGLIIEANSGVRKNKNNNNNNSYRDRLREAGRLMEVVSHTRRRHLGPRHVLFALSILEQGVIAAELGQHRQATILLRKAIELRTQIYGADHPQTRHAVQLLEEIS